MESDGCLYQDDDQTRPPSLFEKPRPLPKFSLVYVHAKRFFSSSESSPGSFLDIYADFTSVMWISWYVTDVYSNARGVNVVRIPVYSVTMPVSQVLLRSLVFVVDTSARASRWLCNRDGWVIRVVKADGFRGGNVLHSSGSPFPLLMIKRDLVIPQATSLTSSFFSQLSRKGRRGFSFSAPPDLKYHGCSALGHGGTRQQMEQKDACAAMVLHWTHRGGKTRQEVCLQFPFFPHRDAGTLPPP